MEKQTEEQRELSESRQLWLRRGCGWAPGEGLAGTGVGSAAALTEHHSQFVSILNALSRVQQLLECVCVVLAATVCESVCVCGRGFVALRCCCCCTLKKITSENVSTLRSSAKRLAPHLSNVNGNGNGNESWLELAAAAAVPRKKCQAEAEVWGRAGCYAQRARHKRICWKCNAC